MWPLLQFGYVDDEIVGNSVIRRALLLPVPRVCPSDRRDSHVVSNALETASPAGFGPGVSRVRDAGDRLGRHDREK